MRTMYDNAQANEQRVADTEEFTAGVRETLDDMRRQSKAEAAAKRAERSLAAADRQSKVAEAKADFQAAVDKANALKPADNDQRADADNENPPSTKSPPTFSILVCNKSTHDSSPSANT